MEEESSFQVVNPESRVTLVVTQTVHKDQADAFLRSQREIHDAASKFPGFVVTRVYPPLTDTHDDWVVVVHFENSENLSAWLDSPERLELSSAAEKTFGKFRIQRPGFDVWFPDGVPNWKMALSVLFALYPTVMVLTFLFPGPYIKEFNSAQQMLIGNTLSVCLLQWVLMPAFNAVFSYWLHPEKASKASLVATPILLWVLMFIMVWGFDSML